MNPMSLADRLRVYASVMKAQGNEVIAELLLEARDVLAQRDGIGRIGFTLDPVRP